MNNNRQLTAEQKLQAEVHRLRSALAGLIPWAGLSPEGPAWATPEAKQRNRQMFEKAFDDACECFPEGYNGLDEMVRSN
jgi:hypothetical protein